MRLARAASYLRRSDLPVSDIAYLCGFSSPAHLTVAFRREHGDVVVRASSRRVMVLGPKGMTKELLSPDAVPGVQMIRIVIQPGGSSGDQPYNNESGAKCGTVVAGTLGLEVSGQEHVLAVGDSFAFAATRLHRFWCIGAQPVELIWVVTPAVY